MPYVFYEYEIPTASVEYVQKKLQATLHITGFPCSKEPG